MSVPFPKDIIVKIITMIKNDSIKECLKNGKKAQSINVYCNGDGHYIEIDNKFCFYQQPGQVEVIEVYGVKNGEFIRALTFRFYVSKIFKSNLCF